MSKNTSISIFIWSVGLLLIAHSVSAADTDTVITSVGIGVCGNTIAEGVEDCDTLDLAGASCQTLGHTGGTLSCTPSCSFDTSMCTDTPVHTQQTFGYYPHGVYTFPQPVNVRPDVYRPVLDVDRLDGSALSINASDVSGVRGISLCSFSRGCVDFSKNFLIKDETIGVDYIQAFDKAGNVTTYFVDPGAIKRRQIMTQITIIVIIIGLFVGIYKLIDRR